MNESLESPVRIREADSLDVMPIVEVYVHASNTGYEGREPWKETDAARVERWRHDLSEATPTRWWVAEMDGRIVGVVGIGPCRDPVEPGLGELDTIAVSPDAWHRGIGKRLMARALEGLRDAGFRRACLWTLNDYPLGERFYVATGWRRSGSTRQNGQHIRYDRLL
jgi:N-acetylglutamate synthase-like GNAT family acetyltransferase